jgi:putative SOS response-associated peptidase YedK
VFVITYRVQYGERMCGRFTLHSRDRIRLKGAPALDLPFEPRYNIAPSQTVADFGRGPELHPMIWGLIPSWSNDGKGFINARAETLEEKPSFSESFRLRRCLIPADGFFEWVRPASRLDDCLAVVIGPDLLFHQQYSKRYGGVATGRLKAL